LSRIGAARDAKWLREWITEPEAVDPFASMPPFGNVLSEAQMTFIVNYLANRK
jgi:cytochrome c1